MDKVEESTEVWRDIPGCEGSYSVSSWGRIKSLARIRIAKGVAFSVKEKILKSSLRNCDGYLGVNLRRYGVVNRPQLIHRLVAEAFLGPCPDGMECAHLDGNRQNPRLENLAWKTHKANEDDKERHGTRSRGVHRPLAKLSDDAVKVIIADTRANKHIAAEYGVDVSLISRVKRRKLWKHVV